MLPKNLKRCQHPKSCLFIVVVPFFFSSSFEQILFVSFFVRLYSLKMLSTTNYYTSSNQEHEQQEDLSLLAYKDIFSDFNLDDLTMVDDEGEGETKEQLCQYVNPLNLLFDPNIDMSACDSKISMEGYDCSYADITYANVDYDQMIDEMEHSPRSEYIGGKLKAISFPYNTAGVLPELSAPSLPSPSPSPPGLLNTNVLSKQVPDSR